VLHVRRTDYVANGWALPFAYYEEAMNLALPSGGEVWIATDDAADPFFARFARWQPRFLSMPMLQEFSFMLHSRRLVLSQSSFSWWPAFLGDADLVIAPRPANGVWSGDAALEGASLLEDDRVHCLKCGGPDRLTAEEDRYQSARKWKRDWILRLNRRLGLSLKVPPP
jgi:hypothetical protein